MLTPAQAKTVAFFKGAEDMSHVMVDDDPASDGSVILSACIITFGEREQYIWTLNADGSTAIH